jgi:hypothetical protein
LHGDDTTVPVLAKGKTDTGRLWVYVRDDAPFGGPAPPAALFHYSRDRRGTHPRAHLAAWTGILQADAYGGYGEFYQGGREPGPVLEAGCFAHARRKFFELADVESAARKKSRGERTGQIYPIALEAVQRLDALFDIERAINGKDIADRFSARQELSTPLMTDLHAWLHAQLAKLSRNHDLAKAINYMLRRWPAFTASSMTAGSASPTTPRSAPCAALLLAANRGCSADRIAVVSAPLSCSRSSVPPS